MNSTGNRIFFFKIIKWGYLVAFLLFLLSSFLSFYSNDRLVQQSKLVSHTYKVLSSVDFYLSKFNEEESAVRGYLVTGDSVFLKNHNYDILDSVRQELIQLTKDNALQQKRLADIDGLKDQKRKYLDSSIVAFNDNGFVLPERYKNRREGKRIMDEIKKTAAAIKDEETSLLKQRDENVTQTAEIITWINMISLVIAVGLIIYSVMTYYRENSARREADKKVATYHDELEARVEELKKLNNELTELKNIEKFALTGRISRTIAHEVRNPLTNINLAVEQLKAEIPDDSDSSMLLEMVTRNANRINQLITDLLNSTKMNLLTFEHKNIHALLDESLEFAEDRIELKGIKVKKEYTGKGCDLKVDSQKIKIAFLNIIVNAIEAMEPGKGVLTIKTDFSDNKCKVTISDNGSGIDAENLSKLFEPYFTTKETGTGLGLTNTQNIIISHNASVSAESEKGKGTSFFITFNIAGGSAS